MTSILCVCFSLSILKPRELSVMIAWLQSGILGTLAGAGH
jgi:hypothetical protein